MTTTRGTSYHPDGNLVRVEPGIDGLEVVRQLRGNRHLSGARIVLSTHASGEVRRLTEALKCTSYLTKPFSTTELVPPFARRSSSG